MTNQYLTQLAERSCAIVERNNLFTDEIQDIILIASEVVELTKALQKGKHADREAYNKTNSFENCIKDTIEDEFADIILRILSYYKHYDYDIIAKLDANVDGDIYKILRVILYYVSSFNLKDAIRLTIALAEREGIDLEWHLEAKLKYNETRKW